MRQLQLQPRKADIQNDRMEQGITSIGSPSAVPVPWASSVVFFVSLALTVRSSHYYEDPLGAVRLALGPSCYTADPSTWHSLSSSILRLSKINAPAPSALVNPSARESKV